MKVQLAASAALVLLSAIPGALSAKHRHLRATASANDSDLEDETPSYWKNNVPNWKKNVPNWKKNVPKHVPTYKPGDNCHFINDSEIGCDNTPGCKWKGNKCRPSRSDEDEDFDSQDFDLEASPDDVDIDLAEEGEDYDWEKHLPKNNDWQKHVPKGYDDWKKNVPNWQKNVPNWQKNVPNWQKNVPINPNTGKPYWSWGDNCHYIDSGTGCDNTPGCRWRGGTCRPSSSEDEDFDSQYFDLEASPDDVDIDLAEEGEDYNWQQHVPKGYDDWKKHVPKDNDWKKYVPINPNTGRPYSDWRPGDNCHYIGSGTGCDNTPGCKWRGGTCRPSSSSSVPDWERHVPINPNTGRPYSDWRWGDNCHYINSGTGCDNTPGCKWRSGKCRPSSSEDEDFDSQYFDLEASPDDVDFNSSADYDEE